MNVFNSKKPRITDADRAGTCQMCGWNAPRLFHATWDTGIEILNNRLSAKGDICEPCVKHRIPQLVKDAEIVRKFIKKAGLDRL